jgi:ring-1,2-phenylacetyl-CoA epoxidase subunit PaaE
VATHFRTLKIKEIRRETADCVSVSFELPPSLQEEFRFTQGQNITIRSTIHGEQIRRSYSICSSPLDQELRIAIKKVDGGRFSSFANSQLREGNTLELLPPTGNFFTELNPANQKNYVAFAAGSGITPVISIIKTTLATEPHSRFFLIYGNRNKQSIIFKESLQGLKDRYMDRLGIHFLLSREKTDATINQGRIDPKKCEELFEKMPTLKKADEFFICGPESMIFSVKDWLGKNQMEAKKIHYELFSVPGEHSALASRTFQTDEKLAEQTSKISITQDGITFDFFLAYGGPPILDAALSHGADLPFSCKGGVCATCRAKLVSGKVEMETNYALGPDEINAGYILTCQSHPRSEMVSVDFDQRG